MHIQMGEAASLQPCMLYLRLRVPMEWCCSHANCQSLAEGSVICSLVQKL